MSGLPSPCVRNCCLHPETDICMGCHRSLHEILSWHSANDIVRQEILLRVAERRIQAEAEAEAARLHRA